MKKSKIVVLLLAVAMMFLFTACNSTDYKNAVTLLEEGNYAEAITVFEALGDYKDSATKLEEAKTALKIEEATELLCEGTTWFFNGGSDTTVNNITFTKEAAIIGQTYYDGNGPHTKPDSSFTYVLDAENIIVTLADGSELKIPYTVKKNKISLDKKEYFTAKEVEKGLQGYWTYRSTPSYVSGIRIGASEYIYYFNNGKVVFESASEGASIYQKGTVFYYGPKTGTYVIDENGLSVEAQNNWQFGFNIIDGEVVMVRCTAVCERTDGFKGEGGFKF